VSTQRPFSTWSVIRGAMSEAITAYTGPEQYEVVSAKLDGIARLADDAITSHYNANTLTAHDAAIVAAAEAWVDTVGVLDTYDAAKRLIDAVRAKRGEA
jgi:hypothetical protein